MNEEDWENIWFTAKGDYWHVARITAKYGGLKYIDSDNPDQCGEFRKVGCVFLRKCSKNAATQKRKEKGIFPLSWDAEGHDDEFKPECQVECMHDLWERTWSFYDMIADYSKAYPDPKIELLWDRERMRMRMVVESRVLSSSM